MSYPEKFDTSNLDKNQMSILADFHQRRNLFDKYLTEKKIELNTCPGCGYPTLTERGGYEICCVCNWEDDNQDDKEADEIWGGPNYELSLTENRLNIGEQLVKNAEEIGGRINIEPSVVLTILSRHNKKVSKLFEALPEDADLNHPIVKDYKEKGQELLKQLVTT
jgi:hypothetical protein